MIRRSVMALGHDAVAVVVAWIGSYWIRFNFDIPPESLVAAGRALVWIVPIYVVIYFGLGLYKGIWRYASMEDLRRLLVAVGLGAIVAAGLTYMLQAPGIPRSVLALHPMLLVLILGGDRYLYRAWKDGHLFGGNISTGTPVLVLGAGDAASTLLKELGRSNQWHAVGLLDDNPRTHGLRVGDVPILGAIDSVGDQARRCEVESAIIAMPAATAAARRRAAELAAAAGLTVFTVPAYADILSGRVSVSSVRRVELEDLLGREQVQLDEAGLQALLAAKTIMVTGAGGSIGSELCRQIARFAPAKLVLFEQSEFALYRIEQEFAGRWPQLSLACLVGDVKDAAAVDTALAVHRPAVIFHAAAYKHVPLMEGDNAWAAVRNNVLGTLTLARAARAHGVGEFVLISTDKAVNPTNVMGASKRLAEMVCQTLQDDGDATTRFVMVRFGNVLGSSGSVIPKFREQIARGGPITVTHPDIVRYFMLIPEAAQLVLQAGQMANGEACGGRIFVLDMGEPIKIADLARDMIRLSGFSEDDIRLEFTGLRPGEKLYEELLADDETTLPTPHPKLRVARAQAGADGAWLADIEAWLAESCRDTAAVKRGLAQRVPEYRPQ